MRFDRLILGVDFDGTVGDHRYPKVGPDVPHAVESLLALTSLGTKLVLNTMRGTETIKPATQWFSDRKIPLFGIWEEPLQHTWTDSPKCYAHLYVDDAAIGCPLIQVDGFHQKCVDWLEVMKMLKEVR